MWTGAPSRLNEQMLEGTRFSPSQMSTPPIRESALLTGLYQYCEIMNDSHRDCCSGSRYQNSARRPRTPFHLIVFVGTSSSLDFRLRSDLIDTGSY